MEAEEGTVTVVADQRLVRVCTLAACPGVREERVHADAALLAAAPLMLLALREVAGYVEQYCPPSADYPRMLVAAAIHAASPRRIATRHGAAVVG